MSRQGRPTRGMFRPKAYDVEVAPGPIGNQIAAAARALRRRMAGPLARPFKPNRMGLELTGIERMEDGGWKLQYTEAAWVTVNRNALAREENARPADARARG